MNKDKKRKKQKLNKRTRALQTLKSESSSVISDGTEIQTEENYWQYGQYVYGDIIRDFPTMLDYLGHLRLAGTNTCIDLLGLAQSLCVRINYSSELKTDFMLHRPHTGVGRNERRVEAVLIVTGHAVTYQQQAWLVGQGLATYILNIAEYIPDFTENQAAMTKWTVDKLAGALLLPDDLVVRVTELAMDLNEPLLNVVDTHNQMMLFNTPRASIIAQTASRLANVPEWLMIQRIATVYNG
ncbi:hypothetical protein [Loigolactobacillus zhaoyuanensis]|uniref:Uncharacterized protein n=1 Tax=Loigolactobacillus zhaoyuanensis TaxID=2486017 RepID=A0ABW8UFS1_9LACO|nr:hypothetical protein [Loigolactobacillus zhaoyuanensis]